MSPNPARPWKTRHQGIEYGPYTDAEMISFISQQRITTDTEVQHPRFTQGLWLTAKMVGPLSDQLPQAKSPPPLPAKPTTVPAVRVAAPPSGQLSARRKRRSRYASYKWALLAIWSAWFFGFLWLYVRSITENARVFSPDVMHIANRLTEQSIFNAMAVAIIPLVIVSVILYFFMVDR